MVLLRRQVRLATNIMMINTYVMPHGELQRQRAKNTHMIVMDKRARPTHGQARQAIKLT